MLRQSGAHGPVSGERCIKNAPGPERETGRVVWPCENARRLPPLLPDDLIIERGDDGEALDLLLRRNLEGVEGRWKVHPRR